ncbi:hypothetical protein IFM89_004320 [Coptis chinensis]|uniref:Tetrahydrofolate dehydrogenase/cyclohydrolase NAD(P)-binding domain-containing protein n=1 Tax=Coptis chinensis TaxID=261450 RepID=A0A835I9Q7_9MAGN|nr:hypothetical protein IFM89_004320 [Coptis chinensis]
MKGEIHYFSPCTPKGCLELLSRRIGISVKSKKKAVVVGRRNIVGLPAGVASSQSRCHHIAKFTHALIDYESIIRGSGHHHSRGGDGQI